MRSDFDFYFGKQFGQFPEFIIWDLFNICLKNNRTLKKHANIFFIIGSANFTFSCLQFELIQFWILVGYQNQ